jgi:hypothetical protein
MNQPNPIWQKLLEKIPPAMHPMVQPILNEWDAEVTQKFQEIHKEYEPLKAFQPFVDNNITPDFAWQSVTFADELQREPAKVAQQINEHWKLGYVPKEEYDKVVAEKQTSSTDDDELFNEDGTVMDLTKIPEFQTMKQALDALQAEKEQEKTKAEQDAELREFEEELEALEKSVTQPEDGSQGKPFNRMFVTALMAQGLSGEEAVKQYHQILGETVQPDDTDDTDGTSDAPITMGNSGTVGGGLSDGEVKWAEMPTSDFNANVAKVLESMMGSE